MRKNLLVILTMLNIIATFCLAIIVATGFASPTTADQLQPTYSEADIDAAVERYYQKKELAAKELQKQNLIRSVALAPEFTPGDRRIYGSEEARITIQMFSDIECPFCRQMHYEIKTIVDSSQGVINWEFKHLPLQRHFPAAMDEALIVECASIVHNNQTAWLVLNNLVEHTAGGGKGVSDLDSLVSNLPIRWERIQSCMDTQPPRKNIEQTFTEAKSMDAHRSTPTLIIVDNQTGQKGRIPGGMQPKEKILMAIQSFLQ